MAAIGVTDVGASIGELISSLVQEKLVQQAQILPLVTTYAATPGINQVKVPRMTGSLTINDKVEDTCDTPQAMTVAVDVIEMSHWIVSTEIEKIALLQSAVDFKSQVLMEMAKQMALKVDTHLLDCLKQASAAAPDHRVLFANSPTNTIQQTDILEARRLLNKALVPQSERYLLVPADQEKALLSIADFVRADQYGANVPALATGELGRLYGFTVLMGEYSNLAANECVFWHKSAVGYSAQQQVSYSELYLPLCAKTQIAIDMVAGCEVLDSGRRQVLFNSTGA